MKAEASEHVIIGGQVFLYGDKEPFVSSGVSVKGALEYDEEDDRIKCHECGAWMRALGSHLHDAHHVTAREYKIKHGLTLKSALICEGVRKALIGRQMISKYKLTGSKKGHQEGIKRRGWTTEALNRHGLCQAQVLKKLRDLAEDLGHTPTQKEMRRAGLSPCTLARKFNVLTSGEVMEMAGLVPNKKHVSGQQYSSEVLIELLKQFWLRHNRTPSASDERRGIIPSRTTYRKKFGSWKRALRMAEINRKGFDQVYRGAA